jgi:predicted dehydrogenase
MPKSEIVFGHIGCGRVAQRYVEVFTQGEIAGGRLSHVCDIVPARAQDFARRANARSWTDLAAMLRDARDVDCVTISTPSGDHAAHVRAALEAGKHVVVEKPVTMRPEHALELAALAARKGLMFCVIKQNRYNPAMRALKGAVDEGRFGTLVLGTVRVRWARDMGYYNGDAWRGKFVSDGGVITNQAIHHIDGLQWVMGPVEAVCARGMARLNDIEVDDTTVAILRFANGASGVIEATTAARPADIEASLSVLGEGGSVVVGGWALNEVQFWKFAAPRPGDETAPSDFSQVIPTSYGFGHAPLLQEVIDRLKQGDTTPPIDAREATKSLGIIHALYRSMEDGGWVHLGDDSLSRRLGVGP